MAMTKKEQAAMQAAIDRAELLAALRWTNPVPFDVHPPSADGSLGAHTEGWAFNAHALRVEQAWSESVFHGHGPYPKDKRYRTASQRAVSLHSSKLLALMAMRHEVEIQCAKSLMQIDRQIADEKGGA